ncbi:MAG: uracil-DNA glycosylase [Ignavibacteria bacterium]|nr:uracil-DNA glycosylase [Ignavibacteria bacterium]
MDIFGNVVVKRESWEFAESLDELNSMICNCKKCPLGETRTNFVFGVGNPMADIVLIGEAPGAEEDAQGEPFVGRAGQLLNKILEATGFSREEVYIMNILKCRPPGNRNPLPEEVEKCRPYLEKQLKLINPKLILMLGKVAADALLKTREPLHKIRGKILNYKEWKVMVTFHPAALLRNPHWKRPAWEDMQKFRDYYKTLIS